MCKQILKNGNYCKKAIGKDYCHIHMKTKYEINEAIAIIEKEKVRDELNRMAKLYISSLEDNKKLINKFESQIKFIEDMKDEFIAKSKSMIKRADYQKNEISNLNKTIENKNNFIKEKNNKIIELEEKINSLKEDYDKYQIIKEFEKEKNDLINQGIDIYNYYNDDYHNKRYQRNLVAHAIC